MIKNNTSLCWRWRVDSKAFLSLIWEVFLILFTQELYFNAFLCTLMGTIPTFYVNSAAKLHAFSPSIHPKTNYTCHIAGCSQTRQFLLSCGTEASERYHHGENSTCPSFRVIWPCSLQPMKVLLHLNTRSPARTR